MEANEAVYYTPEQIAEKLQVVTATVYRWLRSGKLRGSRITAKAWRVSQTELDAFMRGQNFSELLFEQYMEERGLGSIDHEPAVPGRISRLDYRLIRDGKPLWFEVKEFGEVDTGPGGAFDPYISIRNRIGKAAKQLSEYKGECCSLVFYNDRINLASIYSPEIVLGAMLGNVSVRILVNTQTGEEVGPPQQSFAEGGKLIHPTLNVPQNTTISAIISLQHLNVGAREFRVKVEAKEQQEQRRVTWTEFYELMEADRARNERQVLRTLVCENPYAAVPLPRDMFTGPYDERWGPVEDKPQIGRIFVGDELKKLEVAEESYDLHIGPLQRLAKNGGRKRREP